MLPPFTLTLSPVPLIHLTIYPLAVLSSSPVFLCCFTSQLPVCHPLPLFLWPAPFSSCYLSFLLVFYPTYFHLFRPLASLSFFFSSTTPPPLHNSSSLSFPSLPPFLLSHFPPSSLLVHSLAIFHPTPLAYGSGQCSPSILAQAGGRWVSPWLHTHAHRHMRMCLHTQTCWGWLMSNARLSASMPIRVAQETSLGLLASAWHWLGYSPACLFHSGKNLKSWGYTLLNIDNHKQWLQVTDQTQVQELQS